MAVRLASVESDAVPLAGSTVSVGIQRTGKTNSLMDHRASLIGIARQGGGVLGGGGGGGKEGVNWGGIGGVTEKVPKESVGFISQSATPGGRLLFQARK